MWYHDVVPSKPIQISIELDLLRRIDADPETREKGRSAFVRSAVADYLAAKRRRAIDLAIGAAYGEAADAMAAEVSGLLDAQAWPRD
jgi:metal-responsive CopG/Arc/MetJ family transcriptional regulator